MSDWHACRVCGMAHPWPPTEKPCPNAAIVARTGLRGLAALRASGLLERGLGRPRAANSPANAAANSPAAANTDRRAYMRELMRRKRAALREVRP